MKTVKRSRQLALLLAVLPAAAFAHAHLESARPANRAVLAAAPKTLTLQFSEAVTLTSVTLGKVGHSAAKPVGPLPEGGRQQVVPLPKLQPGVYVLRYVAVSDDTHEARGTLHFTVTGMH